jgi:hypothetical protein
MAECNHHWEMANVQYGFVVFEKCYHCNSTRTFFSNEDTPLIWDKYREGDCFWNRVQNSQSIRFDLKCDKCGHLEKFEELMGFLYCTGCIPECDVELLQRKIESERTWLLVAFGYLPESESKPLPLFKLDILTDYFNQRRDTSRSKIQIVSFNMIDDVSLCKGELIHDVGMLSNEPQENKPQF